jgi:hypothetical protein
MKYVVAALTLLACSSNTLADAIITSESVTLLPTGAPLPRLSVVNGYNTFAVMVGGATRPNGPFTGTGLDVMRGQVFGTIPETRPWNTVYRANTLPNVTVWYEAILDGWRRAGVQWLCLFAITTSEYVNIGSCVPFDGSFQTPTSCRLSLPATIRFGTVSSSAHGNRESITGTVTCDDRATVTVSGGDASHTSGRVSLSANNDAYAQLDLNGNNPLPGITLVAERNTPRTFTLGASLELLPNVLPGAYSGSSVVRIDWP